MPIMFVFGRLSFHSMLKLLVLRPDYVWTLKCFGFCIFIYLVRIMSYVYV